MVSSHRHSLTLVWTAFYFTFRATACHCPHTHTLCTHIHTGCASVRGRERVDLLLVRLRGGAVKSTGAGKEGRKNAKDLRDFKIPTTMEEMYPELPSSKDDDGLFTDDFLDDGPPLVPVLLPNTTQNFGIDYYDIWPGLGASPREGQVVRVRWNIAHSISDLFSSALQRPKAWKGDYKLEFGSWEWPNDTPLEYVFGQDPYVIPGFEEVLATMKEGGRRHCVINPEYGFRVEEGDPYNQPMPSDPDERDRMIAWMTQRGLFDEKEWKQKRPIAWEIDLERVRDRGDAAVATGPEIAILK